MMDALHLLVQIFNSIVLIVLGGSTILTFLLIYTITRPLKREFQAGDIPSLWTLAIKVLWRAVALRQGVLYSPGDDAHPQAATSHDVLEHGCRLDKARLSSYMKVCRHNSEEAVPLCFLETLFLRHVLILAMDNKCRVSPLGLIHIRQTVTVRGDLKELLDHEFSLHTSVLQYRQVARGVEVDIGMGVRSSAHPAIEEVWSGVTTLLSRNAQAQRSGQTRSSSQQQPDLGEHRVCELSVPGDMGLRYAKVSGDWNPHHLYPWSARLLGYRKPIAHGMWTLAVAVAEVQAHPEATGVSLDHPVQMEAAFKRPLFMPGQVVVRYGGQAKGCWFQVVDRETGAPHVVGSIH